MGLYGWRYDADTDAWVYHDPIAGETVRVPAWKCAGHKSKPKAAESDTDADPDEDTE